MKSIDDVRTLLQSSFASGLEARRVPGASLAILYDGEVLEMADGVLSTTTGVEATTDSIFQVGSITKVWTATLVMQLVDDGLLDLDIPIRSYLPEFQVEDDTAAATITARHLLSHQSGFEGDVFTDTGRGDDAVERYIPGLAELPQLFPPGELFSYNNAAFSVLGRLVEVLRGETWASALQTRIAEPLELAHVSPSPYEAILHRAAVGHLPDAEGNLAPAPVWSLAKSNEPAGAMLAMRARDLIAFAQMHMGDGVGTNGSRVLSAGSAREMRGKQVDLPKLTGLGDAWGLGWEITVDGDPAMVGHDGGTVGQAAFFRIVPDLGFAVALLTNGGDGMGLLQDVVGPIVQAATGITLPTVPVPPAEPVAVDPAPLVGRYSNSTMEFEVSLEGEEIWLDSVPKGIMLEIGQKPQRVKLVGYAPDTLIDAEPTMKGIHLVYSFLGDDGTGRRAYVHFGRVVGRID